VLEIDRLPGLLEAARRQVAAGLPSWVHRDRRASS
jgi:hypothetical protein